MLSTRSSKVWSAVRPQVEVLEDRCLLSAGDLDPTFGSGGWVTTTTLAGTRRDSRASISGR